MQVVLEIDPATEAQVRDLAARGEREEVVKLLSGPLEKAVHHLLASPAKLPPLPQEEVDRMLDEWDRFTEDVASELGPGHTPLPEEALTREGIYGDHP